MNPISHTHSRSLSLPSKEILNALTRDLDELKKQHTAQNRSPQVQQKEIRDLFLYCILTFTLCTGGWVLMGWGWSMWSWIAIPALALGRFARWILAHHLCHKGYDFLPKLPWFLKSNAFGLGKTRPFLWMDWMTTEAWSYEHNLRHHYRLNEPIADPDFVQEKSQWLIHLPLFNWIKIGIVLLGACVWKPLYYGPNTLLELYNDRQKHAQDPSISIYSWQAWSPFKPFFWTLLRRSWLPYLFFNLLLIPLFYVLIFQLQIDSSLGGGNGYTLLGGETGFELRIEREAMTLGWMVFQQALVAEILTNFHSFMMIVPNHSGSDLLQFEGKTKNRGEFYYRQITGSCNYQTGSWFGDFLQGYLNYQIEHHLWPNLTMKQYRTLQPEVRRICLHYRIPYVQEPVWRRAVKMIKIAIGRESHPLISAQKSGSMKHT